MIYENAGAAGEKGRLRQRKGVQLMWFYRSSIGLLKIVEGSDENYYFQFGEDLTLWTAGYEDPEGLAEAINAYRQQRGLPAYTVNADLMALSDYSSNTGVGNQPFTLTSREFMAERGY